MQRRTETKKQCAFFVLLENGVESMYKVYELSKKFGDLEVLKNISVDVQEGEVVCIIGPSGSGKSTFLRCLNLFEIPTGGKMYYNGTNILDNTVDSRLLREEVGMVFQKYNLFPLHTVLENVMLAPVLTKKKNKKEAKT